jgi:hypothetical protein
MLAHGPRSRHEVRHRRSTPRELALGRGDVIERVEVVDKRDGVVEIRVGGTQGADHLVQVHSPRPLHRSVKAVRDAVG